LLDSSSDFQTVFGLRRVAVPVGINGYRFGLIPVPAGGIGKTG